MKSNTISFQKEYRCLHCQAFVSTHPDFSGVQNRNHCPYCLWSRHLDHFEAGDRLSACKAPMEPIGLTVKAVQKRYGSNHGELMLIHRCVDCGKISINRLAADDLSEEIAGVYHTSLTLNREVKTELLNSNIHLLGKSDYALFRKRLYGELSTWKPIAIKEG